MDPDELSHASDIVNEAAQKQNTRASREELIEIIRAAPDDAILLVIAYSDSPLQYRLDMRRSHPERGCSSPLLLGILTGALTIAQTNMMSSGQTEIE